MSELRGQSVLIVATEITTPIGVLQEQIERAGADAMVVGDHPEAITDTLQTFEFTAAVVNGDNHEIVAQLQIPTVFFYDTDPPEQVLSRLQRVLSADQDR